PIDVDSGGFTFGAPTRINSSLKVGISGDETIDRLLHVENSTSSTNTVVYATRLTTVSINSPAAGLGVGIEFEVETSGGNNEVGATIEAVVTDVTSTSEDFDLVFKTMGAGAPASEKMR